MKQVPLSLLNLPSLSRLLLLTAVGVMALHPLQWLVGSWWDASYDSQGFVIFLCCAVLFLWSVRSPCLSLRPVPRTLAYRLLALTTLVRLAGQVMAVNLIGALALVVDVYALGVLARLQWRAHPVSPFWLAVCFAFSLPLERVVQRVSGYGLQHLSAEGACMLLGQWVDGVTCHGVRIAIQGQDVLVDLPCSGARNLLLLCCFFCFSAAICRPGAKQALSGILLTWFSAVVGNILRIVLLALGLHAEPLNLSVMHEPWHSAIGLMTLSVSCLPIVFWARHRYRPVPRYQRLTEEIRWAVPRGLVQEGWWLHSPRRAPRHGAMAAAACLVLACIVVSLPRTAVDVVKQDIQMTLPPSLANAVALPLPLLPKEQAYFAQFGGTAAKSAYGMHTLLLVKTSTPLRHLHAPDACLRGLGFAVAYQGVRYQPIPTAIYKATSPDGQDWRIAVTFMDDSGHLTSNVSEAVWRWLQQPGSIWTAIQRISPWEEGDAIPEANHFDHAVIAALDLPLRPNSLTAAALQGD